MLGSAMLREQVRLDEVSVTNPFTYRWIPDHEGTRAWVSTDLRCQFENLELIPRDVVRQARLRFGLRWDRSRSWLCFGVDEGFSAGGGTLITLVTSFCR